MYQASRRGEMTTQCWKEDVKERDNLEDLSIDTRIT